MYKFLFYSKTFGFEYEFKFELVTVLLLFANCSWNFWDSAFRFWPIVSDCATD